MKKIIVSLLIVTFGFASIAQAQESTDGANFRDLSFDQALAAAKAEGKNIFIDCYTEWCGPCKMMVRDVFPTKEAGDYLNPKFVCIKIDMEKGEGPKLNIRFGVNVYPTFLVLNADGKLLHRFAGGNNVQGLINNVENAFDPTKSLSGLADRFEAGERNPEFLNAYMAMLEKLYAPGMDKVSDALMALVPDSEKISKEYWRIYGDQGHSPVGSECERFLEANKAAFDAVIGKDKVDAAIRGKYLSYYGITLMYDLPIPADPIRVDPEKLNIEGIEDLMILDAAMFAESQSDVEALIGLFAPKADKTDDPLAANLFLIVDKVVGEKGSAGQQKRWAELTEPFSKA